MLVFSCKSSTGLSCVTGNEPCPTTRVRYEERTLLQRAWLSTLPLSSTLTPSPPTHSRPPARFHPPIVAYVSAVQPPWRSVYHSSGAFPLTASPPTMLKRCCASLHHERPLGRPHLSLSLSHSTYPTPPHPGQHPRDREQPRREPPTGPRTPPHPGQYPGNRDG